jgi:spoIIIJ-associated protein
MTKLIATGKTIEAAVKAGLSQLQTTEDRVKIEVLEQPAKGLFGFIGVKEAKVELELLTDAVEQAALFLKDLFISMNMDAKVTQTKDREGIHFDLQGPELGILIGKRGQTLDALQYLVNIVANRHSDTFLRISLDAENFRERRKKTLEELANKLATRVIRSQKEVVLEPMNAHERKIIHSELQDHPTVKTFSKGDEPNRRIVISLR